MTADHSLWVLIVVALAPTIAAVAALVAAWRGVRQGHEIHSLVNSRLSEALNEIVALKAEVARLKKKS